MTSLRQTPTNRHPAATVGLLSTILLGALSAIFVRSGSESRPFKWPEVEPLHRSFYFPDATHARVELTIEGRDKKALYRLKCEPGYVVGGDTIDLFECLVDEAGFNRTESWEPYESLLNEDPIEVRAATNRAEIWASQLKDTCADYPEYGRVRNFRLRGMKLTLEIKDIELAMRANPTIGAEPREIPVLRRFGLDVSVSPDREAVSAVAEPPPFRHPCAQAGTAFFAPAVCRCDKVLAAHIPGVVTEDYFRQNELGPPFPQVVPARRTLTLPVSTSEERDVYFPIFDASGKLAYEFECSAYTVGGGEVEGRRHPPAIDRWGIYCGMFAAGRKDVDLLGDAVDPYSRMAMAQILPDQIYGKCGQYPQWGGRREFRLRGFKLSMEFKNPVFVRGDFAEHAIERVTLDLRVQPDPTATSPVALAPEYIYWGVVDRPNACEELLVRPAK